MLRFIQKTVALSITAILCLNIAFAQNSRHTLQLRNETIALQNNATKWIDSIRTTPLKDPVLALIHFTSLPTQQQKTVLKEQGITLLDYLPDNTYSAFIQPTSSFDGALLRSAYSITDMQPRWKADKYVWKKVSEAKGKLEILVTFYPGVSKAAIKQFTAAMGAQINASTMELYGAYKLVIAADKIHGLATWYGVQNISPVTDMVPYDLQSRPAIKGNISISPTSLGGYGLMGDSVTVGVGDDASGIYHADIKERITNFNPGRMRSHGSHVNGIIGGAGTVDPMAEGMAPHVLLLDYLYDQVIPATGPMLHDYNMTLTNNSYGVLLGDCDYSGTYDGYSRFLDTISIQYPEVLHVFASGNDGWMSCSPYPTGFATVGGGYQPSKNAMVVGSMTDLLGQSPDESRGPTKDGRMKPETIAVGLGAYSTVGVDDYIWAAGTSMAAPQATGALALLTQRYKHTHSGIGPRADLLKTLLLSGTMDLGNPGPDYSYGFGAVDVSRSLLIMDNNRFYIDTVNNGDSQTVNISVPANTAQLKVLLYWHDMPASTASATQLVNDLDLSVTGSTTPTHLPLVCDPTPANVNNVAVEKADHLNNVEQVTIDNPPAGTFAIKVKGYNVPFPAQRYVVAYDVIAAGTVLTYPLGGEQLGNQDTIRIFWNTADRTHTFTAELSTNNGGSWTTLSSAIAATQRYYSFFPAGINSGNCLIRLSKNGTTETMTSGRFAINTQPVVGLAATQCPGYINIHWSPVPGVTSYQVFAKKGLYMQQVGTATDTTYSFSGMSLTEKSYVAVKPVINGIPGYRSKALITIANNGPCTDPVSNGDLMIEKAISPISGRMHTSTQPGSSESVTVQLRNLDNTIANNYSVSYSLNGGPWNTMSTPPIPANGTVTAGATGIDMSATGTYQFTVAVQNLALTDPQVGNDTLRFTVSNLPNDTISLPFLDDFETMDKMNITGRDSFGVAPNGHWDFATGDTAGRIRSFVNEDVTIGGVRSISLDDDRSVSSGSNNLFTGTFNLSNYDTGTTEVRLDFDYVLHGTPKVAAGNVVNSRANDAASWTPLFTYDLNAYPGFPKKAVSLSLTDAARNEHLNFSSSLQVSFGQNDTSLIAAANFGNGITIDNVRIYTVANDAEVLSVVSPLPTNCGLSAAQPLTVEVHNGVNYTLYNVQLFYRADGGTIFSGILDSITAKNTVQYTFPQLLNMPAGTSHSADIWLSVAGDTYLPNDSLLNYKYRNNPIITTYPYLENFEGGDGGYYADGINNSWQFGTPASTNINRAASGTKAWKTKLAGRYNNLEQSYLYSPCFDISGLNAPTLSFSAALDIENCGNVLCDKAYIEYTYNGVTWLKLGSANRGTNWYDSTFSAWTSNGFTRWHVASIPIPKPVGAGTVINFRFALQSDPGATFEGFAIDDVHVFDLVNQIFPAENTTLVSHDLSGSNWTDYLQNNQLLAAVNPQGQSPGTTNINLYAQTNITNPTATQYVMPRSYTITSAQELTDSIGVRLYLLDSEFVNVLADTSCPSCPKPKDAYMLGVTRFNSNSHPGNENNTLADDTAGTFSYLPYRSIQWIPYDKGYYAQFKTRSLSEMWLNDGGPTNNFPTGVDYLNFTAYRSGIVAQCYWTSPIDTAVVKYTIERSIDGYNFNDVAELTSLHNNPGIYRKADDIGMLSSSNIYYRLRWTMTGNNTIYYSPVRKLSPLDSVNDIVNLDAHMIRQDAVLVDWTSYIDGVASQYTLEREINDRGFVTIRTLPSLHHYAQYYSYTDIIGDLKAGDLVHYRLTATFDDGNNMILPVRTVEWTAPNSVSDIYPNPTTDGHLNIVWYAEAGTKMQVTLLDITGKNVAETTVQSGQWKNTTQLQAPYVPKGIYLLRTVIGDKRYTANVVFE